MLNLPGDRSTEVWALWLQIFLLQIKCLSLPTDQDHYDLFLAFYLACLSTVCLLCKTSNLYNCPLSLSGMGSSRLRTAACVRGFCYLLAHSWMGKIAVCMYSQPFSTLDNRFSSEITGTKLLLRC